jgi:hypothetical protein
MWVCVSSYVYEREHMPMVALRARAARARGARQVHRLHEGEGAPRVARPVQALGAPVRPAAAAVRGGAGAALLPRALLHRALGRHHAALYAAAAAALPVAAAAEHVRAWLRGCRPARVRGEAGPSGAAARWRAGTCPTPQSSRRCRRRPTGPT